MWLITPIGFFSIVHKPEDAAADTLTIRARVRSDLEALRDHYLPDLGEILEKKSTDYRFRAVAPRAQVAAAMAAMVNTLDYGNFKKQVAKTQGTARADLYQDLWSVLHRLQSQSKRFATTTPIPTAGGVTWHPRKDDKGAAVEIKKPSKPTPLEAWHQPEAVACVIPDGAVPTEIHAISTKPWTDAPQSADGWEKLAAENPIEEPEFKLPRGYSRRAAGVVVREKNGRVWVVAPSNAFGGYQATFPKGTVEHGMSLQATALVEAFEESGLKVRLIRHLVDVKRSQSYTRYYLAERLGGSPADMGWETQAVLLVPQTQLPKIVSHPNDVTILKALEDN